MLFTGCGKRVAWGEMFKGRRKSKSFKSQAGRGPEDSGEATRKYQYILKRHREYGK